jgi:hypothetical protein
MRERSSKLSEHQPESPDKGEELAPNLSHPGEFNGLFGLFLEFDISVLFSQLINLVYTEKRI